jgi:hypothetical protein
LDLGDGKEQNFSKERRGGLNRMWLKEAWVCIYMRVRLAEWVKIEEGCRKLARIETRGGTRRRVARQPQAWPAGPIGHPLGVISCVVSSIIIYYPISIISHIFLITKKGYLILRKNNKI